ncbi:MAG TPA: molybdopterin-synthase adenylyltransferase MoeB [Abditibacterium sp.]|jgi:adenylyltransferase/sulfurtransferase
MLNNQEIMRYGRHLIMPEVGVTGQEKLKAAKLLMIGAGGLGSPAGLYLAASGIGEITILDPDTVDVSNLQRQILHDSSSVGVPKVESAQKRMNEVNPFVKINAIQDSVSTENVMQLVAEHDIVVDGTDNFETRYIVNDACVLNKKLNVYGSIFRFDGQSTVFCDPNGPCYRCLYPEPPPPGMVPSCAEGGVLGILPGVVGTIQATEAIKIIMGVGQPLIGRLLIYDALAMSFRTLKVRKDPDCPICSAHPTITSLLPASEYQHLCGITEADLGADPASIEQISVRNAAPLLQDGKTQFIDVRSPEEWQITHLAGAKHIPLDDLLSRANELDSAQDYVVYCHHGMRSAKAIAGLQKLGFKKLKNLAGGIDAWSQNVDETVPRY